MRGLTDHELRMMRCCLPGMPEIFVAQDFGRDALTARGLLRAEYVPLRSGLSMTRWTATPIGVIVYHACIASRLVKST